MAVPSHKVVSGDTLSKIAADNYTKYGGTTYNTRVKYQKYLVKLNNIEDPDKIYVGEVIKLTGTTKKTTKNTSSKKAVVNRFGLQSDTSNTLFATWTWNNTNTEKYQTRWYYSTGDGVWFIGSDSDSTTANLKQTTWSYPDNAKQVRFYVKPISKTKTVKNAKGKETKTSYWTADWSNVKTYTVETEIPVPSINSPTIEKTTLTVELDNLDTASPNGTHIQFQVVKDDGSKAYKTSSKLKIVNKHVKYTCTVASGSKYKVRCRAIRGSLYSDWSAYTSNVECTIPSVVKAIKSLYSKDDGTSVHIDWDHAKGAKSYEIEYTTKKIYFDNAQSSVQSTTISPSNPADSPPNYAILTGLESGQEYFFRLRSANGEEKTAWTPIKSIKLGTAPAAPTTWSSTTTVVSPEKVTLYWVHNTEDGSSQTEAELQIKVGSNTATTKTITNSTDPDEKDKTSSYALDTTSYSAGTTIKWRVRTRGIIAAWSDWSTMRTITVHGKPSLDLVVTTTDDEEGGPVDTLTSFPFYIRGYTEPASQKPLDYHVSIISNSSYETTDSIGNVKMVNTGDAVYSKYISSSRTKTGILWDRISAENVDLENNVEYTIKAVVSMDSGLTAEATYDFDVSWIDATYEPNAEISIDEDTLAAVIRPYCERYEDKYYRATRSVVDGEEIYTATTTELDMVTSRLLDNTYTISDDPELEGYPVYVGRDSNNESYYYYIVEEPTKTLVKGVTLAVYRREFDGRFTELATGLTNTWATYILDPHPALDFARYRIVATKLSTGTVSYTDLPAYPVGESSIVIQWDEEWSDFNIDENSNAEVDRPWTGSMLKLPYNIDVSDNISPDVEFVKYIGRSNPVSYYGTQIGSTSTWSTVIPKDDKETLYALRRLQIWMGNVYVREPSGSGYWANVTVSFSQNHKETTIPVTFNITRVEGGA